jgi:hypothetical protein
MMPFPEHLEDKPPQIRPGSKPIQIRMVGSDEVSEDIVFDLLLSDTEGYYLARNGGLSFYIAAQEIDRLMGKKMPHWELV